MRKQSRPQGRPQGQPPLIPPLRQDKKSAEDLYPRGWRAVVGQHAIAEALSVHQDWVQMLWLQEGWESSQDLKKLHLENRSKIAKIEIKSEGVLAKIAPSHQGAALFLNQAPKLDWEQLKGMDSARVLVLDGIEDPHNLGAIIRTAWLMNVNAVLLPQDRATRLTPIVHKVACGGVEHVPVEICAQFANPMQELKDAGFWAFGLSHRSEKVRGNANLDRSIFKQKIPAKIIWCIGAEDKGLRSTTERLCDELVQIPQADAAASYNASVATAMALMETYRQQNF